VPAFERDQARTASLVDSEQVGTSEPHRAAHGLIEVGQNPWPRVAFGDGAADHCAPDGM
jgi:hypothetical protein